MTFTYFTRISDCNVCNVIDVAVRNTHYDIKDKTNKLFEFKQKLRSEKVYTIGIYYI